MALLTVRTVLRSVIPLAAKFFASSLVLFATNTLAQTPPLGTPTTAPLAVPTNNNEPPALAPEQPIGERLAALRSGTVATARLPSEGTAIRTGYATALVHARPQELLRAIHDVTHYPEAIPQIIQAHELRRNARSQDVFVRLEIRPLPPLWARMRYREESAREGVVEVAGHALEGTMDRMELRWRLTPVDDGRHTVVEFWTLVLPSLPIPLPTALLEREQETTARRGVQAVRTRCERPLQEDSSTEQPHTRPNS